MPLFGGLSTQAGAFEPLAGPDARALRRAHGVIAETQYLNAGYGGNLGYFAATGVADVPLVGSGAYIGVVPNDPLSARLQRPNPWTDPSAYGR